MKAIIFDMDGVLIDTEGAYFEAKNMVLSEENIKVNFEYNKKFMGKKHEEIWRIMKDDLSLKFSPEYYSKKMLKYKELISSKTGIIPIKGAVEIVNFFYDKKIPLAIASSSPRNIIIDSLTSINLLDKFCVLLSGEEVKNSKPAPDIFLEAAKLLGLPPLECIVIEDSINGVAAAKAAEMYCVHYNNPMFNISDKVNANIQINDLKQLQSIEFLQLLNI